jgi:tRNA 2-thiouridine synthesizing protein A
MVELDILAPFRSILKNYLSIIYQTAWEEHKMAQINLDCRNQNCPVPLVQVRKALKKAAIGDIIEVVGTHPASKKEIPMAVEAQGQELIEVKEQGKEWIIQIKKIKEG